MSEADPQQIALEPDEPANELERALALLVAGKMDKNAFLRLFLSSRLYILLDGEPQGNTLGCRSPMVFAASPESPRMLALFSSPVKASAMSELFPEYRYTAMVDSLWAIHCAGPSTGIALNPGAALGFELAASGVQELKLAIEENS